MVRKSKMEKDKSKTVPCDAFVLGSKAFFSFVFY